MITRDILDRACMSLSKQPIFREGPMIFSSGKMLNVFLETKKYENDKLYAGSCIADMKVVGDYYATVRMAKKSRRRKQKSE